MPAAARSRTKGGMNRNKENAAPVRTASGKTPKAGAGKKVPAAPKTNALKEKAVGQANAGVKAVGGKKTKAQPKSAAAPIGDDIPGYYRIDAPYIREQWEDATKPMFLKLAPSSSGKHLWGEFDLRVVTGTLRGGPVPTKVGDTCEFEWRGNETGEGEIICPWEDDVPRGTLIFLGDGKIKGTMQGDFLASFEFTGKKLKTPVSARLVKGWKKEFRMRNAYTFDMMQDWKGECAVRMALVRPPELDEFQEEPYESDSSAGEE